MGVIHGGFVYVKKGQTYFYNVIAIFEPSSIFSMPWFLSCSCFRVTAFYRAGTALLRKECVTFYVLGFMGSVLRNT